MWPLSGWRWAFAALFVSVCLAGLLGAVRTGRRCRLSLSRSALTVGVLKRRSAPIVIPREDVEAIRTVTVWPGTGRIYAPQTEIVYRPAAAAQAATIQIGLKPTSPATGLQLSVRQLCLNQALTAWKYGSPEDPDLLDNIEALLHGRDAEETSWL